jgi:hypothetical protein
MYNMKSRKGKRVATQGELNITEGALYPAFTQTLSVVRAHRCAEITER